MKQMNTTNNIENFDFSAAASIQDSKALTVLSSPVDTSVLDDVESVQDFVQQYKSWISTSTNNKFIGLDNYQYACYSAATSEAFDKFYMKNSNKRFRCFRGEYIYHKIAWRDKFNWAYMNDDELRTGDAVIISLPFADTGNKHISHDEVLDTCERLGIPVLIDCCYFGVCSDIEFNLDYDCITDVAFSLSKAFPVAHARIGMRLTKEDNDDTMFAYNKAGLMYTNRLTASLGKRFITEFSPDYMYNTYREKQLEYCQLTESEPSNTVFFGIGNEKWQKYNRGTDSNRLSFHRYLAS